MNLFSSFSNLFNNSSKLKKNYKFINEEEDQPIEYNQDGSCIFYVKTKIFEGPQKGEILERRLKICKEGLKVYSLISDEELEFYPFETIKGFYYAEDNCFVVICRDNNQDNVVWKTANQAHLVKQEIEKQIQQLIKNKDFHNNNNNNFINSSILQSKEMGTIVGTLIEF